MIALLRDIFTGAAGPQLSAEQEAAAREALRRAEEEAALMAARVEWMEYAQKYLFAYKDFLTPWGEGKRPVWLPVHRENKLRDSRFRLEDQAAARVSFDGRALQASGSELGRLLLDKQTEHMAARHELPIVDKVLSHLCDVCLELRDALRISLAGLEVVPGTWVGGPEPICRLTATQFRGIWDTLNASVGVMLKRRTDLATLLRSKASSANSLDRALAEQAADWEAADLMEAHMLAAAVSQEQIDQARKIMEDHRTALAKKQAKKGLTNDKQSGKGKEKI